MNLRTCSVLLLAWLLCGNLAAQYTLSQLSGTSTAPSGSGQSFTPGDAGTFPTSSAYLTAVTFETGSSSFMNSGGGAATYVDIYSDSAFTSFVGASTNSNTWDAGGYLLTKTWSFDSLQLDKAAVYYAVFSTDAIAGSTTVRDIRYTSNVYGGGALIYNGGVSSGNDAKFTATFATSAIPEPSTYAVLAGLGALGFAIVRRQRTARS